MNVTRNLILIAMPLALSACGGNGLFNRNAPDEFAVSRAAPLVLPPDYVLTPPKPGASRPLAADSQQQAIEALFGPGVRLPPKSPGETSLMEQIGADRLDPAIRSTVGDPATVVVNKGLATKEIIDAPVGETDPAIATVTASGG